MATSKAQRVGIWVIAGAMIIGTIAGFAVMIIAPENDAADQKRMEEAYATYQKDAEEYQKKVDAQTTELSAKHFKTFSKYIDTPAKFDASSVKELQTKDLAAGKGEVISDDTKYAIYYLGWNPEGKVFDSSKVEGEDSLKQPLLHESKDTWLIGGQTGGVIDGWNEGLKGMKIGGVRQLTIPADKAYGEQGSGEDIPANTPIKFIVIAIEHPGTITQPELPQELLQ